MRTITTTFNLCDEEKERLRDGIYRIYGIGVEPQPIILPPNITVTVIPNKSSKEVPYKEILEDLCPNWRDFVIVPAGYDK